MTARGSCELKAPIEGYITVTQLTASEAIFSTRSVVEIGDYGFDT